MFSDRRKEIIYSLYVPKYDSQFNKSELARGRLVDKYRNTVFKFKDKELLKPIQGEATSSEKS